MNRGVSWLSYSLFNDWGLHWGPRRHQAPTSYIDSLRYISEFDDPYFLFDRRLLGVARRVRIRAQKLYLLASTPRNKNSTRRRAAVWLASL